MWRCFVRDQARVPSVAGAVAPFFVTGTVFFSTERSRRATGGERPGPSAASATANASPAHTSADAE